MLDYRPDLDPRTPGLLTSVNDMVPTARGYKSAFAATTNTAHTYSLQAGESYPNKLFASRWLSQPGGIVLTGTNKRLSVYDYTNGFINVSKAGDYTLGGQTFQYGEDGIAAFDICAFGDRIIACNKSTATQHRTALDLTSGTLFADLSGTPKANTCAAARNFVFLGDLAGTFGSTTTAIGQADMIAWSGIGDYTDWTNNVQVTQSSYAVFNDTPGAVTAIRPFRDGIMVFKADSMYLGRYVGAGVNSPVWDFERISDRVGCVGHRSVTDIDNALVFVGRDDIWIYDGTPPRSITRGFYQSLASLFTTFSGLPALVGHDKTASSVWFPIFSGTFVWNYKYDRWGFLANNSGRAEIPCQTNVDDFRVKTLSTVTAGVQSYTTSTDHFQLYTLTLQNGAPKNRGTLHSSAAVSTLASLNTGVWGQPNKLQTLSRINPIYAQKPSTVSSTTISTYVGLTPNPSTFVSTTTMNSNFRCDVLAAGITSNFHLFIHACSQLHEIIDIVPTFTPAGER